ncbi:MAG: D-alanyl-D-alanine carboxypeptidase/D-alanyl-D-alanine endopeptidase [Acidiferrobacteraceae bacterium]
MRIFLFSLLLYGMTMAPACADPVGALPRGLAHALLRSGIPPADVSVFVQRIGARHPSVAFNADVARDPASTMKLLSTFVALEDLGPAYRWRTAAFSSAPIVDGVLKGNLYLKGYADPYFITKSFWNLLHGLRAMGIRDITGNLIVDTSYLRLTRADRGSIDGMVTQPYNTDPSALSVNFQAIKFRFLPHRRTGHVQIVADPHPTNLSVENHVRLVYARCSAWDRRIGLRITHGYSGDRVVFSGDYPVSCGDSKYYRVVDSATRYVYGVFKELWRQQGGVFNGALKEEPVPRHTRRLYEVKSQPLTEILYDINKFSNNLMAREVVMTLGAQEFGLPGTTAKGLDAIRAWLKSHGFRFPELVLQNGVGLSRTERISARHLGQLLLYAYNSRYMPELMASLPIAGVDGTLQHRFVHGPIRGRLHAKTGTLDGVKSLAGYLETRSGKRYVVVCIDNGPRADTYAEMRWERAVIYWAYAH